MTFFFQERAKKSGNCNYSKTEIKTENMSVGNIPVHGSKVQGGVINFQVQRGVIKNCSREGSGGFAQRLV